MSFNTTESRTSFQLDGAPSILGVSSHQSEVCETPAPKDSPDELRKSRGSGYKSTLLKPFRKYLGSKKTSPNPTENSSQISEGPLTSQRGYFSDETIQEFFEQKPRSKFEVPAPRLLPKDLNNEFTAVKELCCLGLDECTGQFVFDPQLRLFVFATSQGNLKLIHEQFELSLPNSMNPAIDIVALQIIPGTGRCLTIGTFPQGSHTTSVLQVWDFSQTYLNSQLKLSDFAPVTIRLAFELSCILRVIHQKEMHPDLLFKKYVKFLRNHPEAQQDDLPVIMDKPRSPYKKVDKAKYLKTLQPEQQIMLMERLFTHPENSHDCYGYPNDDSRWCFLIGDKTGNVRIFDGWTLQFFPYCITLSELRRQINDLRLLTPDNARWLFDGHCSSCVQVVSLELHPVCPSILLIGYSNGLIALFSFYKHRILNVYHPTLRLEPVDRAREEARLCTYHPATLKGSAYQVCYLECMKWDPEGAHFCVSAALQKVEQERFSEASLPSISAFASLKQKEAAVNSPVFLALVTFDRNCRHPIQIVSVDSLFGTSIVATHRILWMHWNKFHSESHKSTMYIQLGLQDSQPSGEDKLPSAESQSISKAARLINVYKLTGVPWTHIEPLFPCGLWSDDPHFQFSVSLIQPSGRQCNLAEASLIESLTGLAGLQHQERDQSDALDLQCKAAAKLGRFLIASSVFLVLATQPVKRLLGCIFRLDRAKQKLILMSQKSLRLNPAKLDPEAEELSSAPDSPINSLAVDDSEFDSWKCSSDPLVFVVPWQSLAGMSRVVSLQFFPRHLSEELQTSRIMSKAALDAVVNATYTLRHRATVNAWLHGMLGQRHRLFLPFRPKEQHLAVKFSSSPETPKSSDQALDRPDMKGGLDEMEDKIEEEEEETSYLNEVPFFGDLLRISDMKWAQQHKKSAKTSDSSQTYQGLLLTAHQDAKVRFWAVTPNLSLHCVYTVSLFSSHQLKSLQSLAQLPLHEHWNYHPDLIDFQIIGETNTKPVINCCTSEPSITCLELYVVALEPATSDASRSSPLTSRYLIVGCDNGAVSIHRWFSRDTVISKGPSSSSAQDLDNPASIPPNQFVAQSSEKVPPQSSVKLVQDARVPCGFQCVAFITKHRHSICCIRLVSVPQRASPDAVGETTTARSRSSFSSPPLLSGDFQKPSLGAIHQPARSVRTRCICGDTAGNVSVIDLNRLKIVHFLPPPQPKSISLKGEQSDGLSSSGFSSSGIACIADLSAPVAFIKELHRFSVLGEKELTSAPPQSFVGVVYHSMLLRILSVSKGAFLDVYADKFLVDLSSLYSVPQDPRVNLFRELEALPGIQPSPSYVPKNRFLEDVGPLAGKLENRAAVKPR